MMVVTNKGEGTTLNGCAALQTGYWNVKSFEISSPPGWLLDR